jgi:hypothetical protein
MRGACVFLQKCAWQVTNMLRVAVEFRLCVSGWGQSSRRKSGVWFGELRSWQILQAL